MCSLTESLFVYKTTQNAFSVCMYECVRGEDNPLISIRRSQRHASADFGHRSQDGPGAKAALLHSCGANAVGLKQTGSAQKDKGVTRIHWNLSQVFRFALFINLSVSLHRGTSTAPGGGSLSEQRCVMYSVYLSSNAALFAFYNLEVARSVCPVITSCEEYIEKSCCIWSTTLIFTGCLWNNNMLQSSLIISSHIYIFKRNHYWEKAPSMISSLLLPWTSIIISRVSKSYIR